MRLRTLIFSFACIGFLSSCRNYTFKVKWLNYNGELLEEDTNLKYGELPEYNGEIPTKPKDEEYTYTFSGWSPKVDKIKGDTTYTAQYKAINNKYKVTFANYNGEELETIENVEKGYIPSYSGSIPTKPRIDGYSYYFTGWSPEIGPITGDTTYTAQFATIKDQYKVTFRNEDGTLLESKMVNRGEIPSFVGQTPTKSKDNKYTYTFNGWDKKLSPCISETTYTATYSKTLNKFTVTWLNYNGSTLETDENVNFGENASYNSSTPSKTDCTFVGFDKSIGAIYENTTYTAEFLPNDDIGTCEYTLNGQGTGFYVSGTTSNDKKYYVIDKTHEGLPVSKIGDNAFSNASNYLEYAIIPTSIKEIGKNAFQNCNKLKSVYFERNGNLELINEKAFDGCTSLNSIAIPSSVTSLGASCFSNCANLESIRIDSNIKALPESLFYNCSKLRNVTLNTSSEITSFPNSCFSYCSSLYELEVPDYINDINKNAFDNTAGNIGFKLIFSNSSNLTSIKNNAFYNSSLREIVIPKGVTSIGEYAFYGSKLIKVSFDSNSSLFSIGQYAFSNCAKLLSISIPNKITKLNSNTFYNCSSLERVEFEENSNLNRICSYSFQNCSNLTSIVLPKNIHSIEEYAFKNCTRLITVDLTNLETLISGGVGMFESCPLNVDGIKVLSGLLESYKTAPFWANYQNNIHGI